MFLVQHKLLDEKTPFSGWLVEVSKVLWSYKTSRLLALFTKLKFFQISLSPSTFLVRIIFKYHNHKNDLFNRNIRNRNMFGYSIAFTCIWITMISTLSCNAIAKVLTLQRQKRIRESDVSGMNERISINSLKPNLKALTTDPNAMMNTIGNHFNKALVWTHTGRQSYQYWLTFMTKMHRQNLRLMLIVNFIWYFTILLWWFF